MRLNKRKQVLLALFIYIDLLKSFFNFFMDSIRSVLTFIGWIVLASIVIQMYYLPPLHVY